MAIYTRTGDKGKTSLFDGTRVFKSSKRVETYGTVDELNSFIGVVITEVKSQKPKVKTTTQNSKVLKTLEEIQHDLLSIGSALATPAAMPVIGLEMRPVEFERLIDEMTEKMPELKNFILPGGGKAGAFLHVCRTISRRLERQVIGLMQEEEIDQNIVKYLNRLSDLFFTMARYANHLENLGDTIWKQK